MKSSLLISLCLVFLCSCQELPIEEYAVIPQPAESPTLPGLSN